MESIRFFLVQGGFTAWLILAAAIILVIVGGERMYYLFVHISFNSSKALTRLRELILERKYTDAIQVCNQLEKVPELRVIKSGLLAAENGREAVRSSLGGTVLEISRACEERLSYISLIASMSTLLGLLGTIMGLITTFAAMAEADPAEKAVKLGAGIAEAMYSTALGLVLGLTAMAIHTICVSKSDGIVGKSQDAGLKLITWLEQSERSKPNV